MKILIVSDTHGRLDAFERALEAEQPLDMLIHLGDVCGDEDYIEAISRCKCVIVAGNNDFLCRLPYERALKIGKYGVHLEHGQRFPRDKEYIYRLARDLGVDIMMFGHTHYPLVEEKNGIWLINPGSLTHPRQPGRMPSYIVMTLDEEGEAQFELHEGI